MPSFPQELTDMVIDLVRDDAKALASLSLTSHNWSPRSRRYLHKTLKIRCYGPVVYPFSELNRAKALLKLPKLMEFAQELVLEDYDYEPQERYWSENVDDDDDSNDAGLLRYIIKRCTNVRLLTFENLSGGLLSNAPNNIPWPSQAFSHITSLTINNATFNYPAELLALLHTLPPLSRLTVNDEVTYVMYMEDERPNQTRALTLGSTTNLALLQELVVTEGTGIKHHALYTIADAFAEHGCSLKKLEISGYTFSSDLSVSVARIFRSANNSLTMFRIHCPAFHEPWLSGTPIKCESD